MEGRKERQGWAREGGRNQKGVWKGSWRHGLCIGTARTEAVNGFQSSREVRPFVLSSYYQDQTDLWHRREKEKRNLDKKSCRALDRIRLLPLALVSWDKVI